MKKTYNKLVRDKIPEIIEANGQRCLVKTMSDEEYLEMVDAKLKEELVEYYKDQSVEELADLLEVLYAAAAARGCSKNQLEQIRADKEEKRGAFQKKILLLEVEDA